MTDPILKNEEEARLTYYNLLRELTFNSKEKINQLSQISEKNSKYARIIVDVVYKHIKEAIPGQKLPTLYLIDSIIKNVGGIYKRLFEDHIVEMFLLVFESGTGDIKTSLYKLRNTWRKVINEGELAKLDRLVKERDTNWPIQSVPETKYVYFNPTFTNGNNPLIKKEPENIIITQIPPPSLPDLATSSLSNPISHVVPEELHEPHQDILGNLDHSSTIPEKKKQILQILREYKKEKGDINAASEVQHFEPMDTSNVINHKTTSPRPHEEPTLTSSTLATEPKRNKIDLNLPGIDSTFLRDIIQSVQLPGPELPPPIRPPIQEIPNMRPPLQIPPPMYPQMQPGPGPIFRPMPRLPPPMMGQNRCPNPPREPHPPRGPPHPRGRSVPSRLPIGPRKSKRSPRGDLIRRPPYQQRPIHRPRMPEPMPHRPEQPRMPPPLSFHPPQQQPIISEELDTEPNSILEGQPYKVVEPEIPKLEMKMESLVGRINVVVQHIHKGEQCGTCGIRFDKNSTPYKTHLDWHFYVNRHKPKSTYWYFPDADWIKYVPDQKEQLSDFFELEKREKWIKDHKEEEEIANVVLRDSELVQRCRICRDLLEMYFDQDNDEWCCKDAVRLGNKVVVHKECAKDYAGPVFDTTPTPVTEKPLGKEGVISPDFLLKGGETPTRKIDTFSLSSEDLSLLINILGKTNEPREENTIEFVPGADYPLINPVINPDKIELDDTDSEDTFKMSLDPIDGKKEVELVEDVQTDSIQNATETPSQVFS
ncbi:Pre-mRNA cleavage complex 2 protein Pcf11 [Oopsacas minuta]|uniref:Pre-mRNA cleavage complex 2 protein Pcf11 n=1 Tax=Oopsacas minuta TaxID=111878 RepID=A0AAV7K1U2_9METZ|nr:Pre-mRNA cleavage complex 2 protein Pcf11 [Oopsacas minuta]